LAVSHGDAARDHVAGHIDGVEHQARGRARGNQDAAAIGAHDAAGIDQCIDGSARRAKGGGKIGFADANGEKAVAGEIHGDQIAGGEGDATEAGFDHAFIADAAADERDIAAGRDANGSGVGNQAGVAAIAESEIAGKKIGVGDVEAGGDEAASVDDRSMPSRSWRGSPK
jgi:hypothetical protein